MPENPTDSTIDQLVAKLADTATSAGLTVAVAESLTGGQLAAACAAGTDAGEWFRGGVVAYHSVVKFEVLGVTPGPVVTPRAAREMAQGVAELLGADLAVAVTGVGGPADDGDTPAGTVVWCTAGKEFPPVADERVLPGAPVDVLRGTIAGALTRLLDRIGASPGR